MSNILKNRLGWLALGLTVFAFMAGTASAVDIYLAAKPFTMTMPDTQVVPMWGYEAYTDGTFTTVLTPVSAPGPLLVVPVGDPTLVIHLRNLLPEPTSIMIPDLYAPLAPVFFTDAQGRQRARAFATETAPLADGVYTWNNVRPGSFIYMSASHPAVQVQMGLYGGVKKDFAAGEAYPGKLYDLEQILFFSEIDSGLHSAVTNGTYGLPNSAYVTTIDYKPKYFLVNGIPYTLAQNVVSGAGTERVLLRCFNGGLKFHSVELLNLYMDLLAEDGYLNAVPTTQYEFMMAPGATLDALVTRPGAGVFHLLDAARSPAQSAAVPDLNLDGLVSSFDGAILADYLNGSIHQGDLPFIAALSAADLNLDGTVNATDLLLLMLMVP